MAVLRRSGKRVPMNMIGGHDPREKLGGAENKTERLLNGKTPKAILKSNPIWSRRMPISPENEKRYWGAHLACGVESTLMTVCGKKKNVFFQALGGMIIRKLLYFGPYLRVRLGSHWVDNTTEAVGVQWGSDNRCKPRKRTLIRHTVTTLSQMFPYEKDLPPKTGEDLKKQRRRKRGRVKGCLTLGYMNSIETRIRTKDDGYFRESGRGPGNKKRSQIICEPN